MITPSSYQKVNIVFVTDIVLHAHFDIREKLMSAQIFTKKKTYHYVYDEVRLRICYSVENNTHVQ